MIGFAHKSRKKNKNLYNFRFLADIQNRTKNKESIREGCKKRSEKSPVWFFLGEKLTPIFLLEKPCEGEIMIRRDSSGSWKGESFKKGKIFAQKHLRKTKHLQNINGGRKALPSTTLTLSSAT